MSERVPIKNRLHEALSLRNMKAVDLCKATGIPKSAMSYYMSGRSEPKSDRIYLISKALNVDEVWLMGHDVSMERKTYRNDIRRRIDAESVRAGIAAHREEIASELHISVEELKQYENGEKDMPLELVEKLAAYFNVPVESLYGVTMFKKNETAFISQDPRQVELHRKWNAAVGQLDFTDEEHSLLIETANFIKDTRESEDGKAKLMAFKVMLEQLRK